MSFERQIAEDQDTMRRLVHDRGPTPLERALIEGVREIYAMTDPGVKRWTRETKQVVRSKIEAIIERVDSL